MDHEDGTIVVALATVLERLIDANTWRDQPVQPVTKFQSSYAPDVTILAYLERIRKYAKCSDSCFVAALIYIDRIIELKVVILSKLNIHRLLITSVLVAAKFLDDLFYNNAFYARLGGVSVAEMNSLELEFLHFIGFSLHIAPTHFNYYRVELASFVTCPPVSAVATIATEPPVGLPGHYSAFASNSSPLFPHKSNASNKVGAREAGWAAERENVKAKMSRIEVPATHPHPGFVHYHQVEASPQTAPATVPSRQQVVASSDFAGVAGQYIQPAQPALIPFSNDAEPSVIDAGGWANECLRSVLGVTRTASTVTPPLEEPSSNSMRRISSPAGTPPSTGAPLPAYPVMLHAHVVEDAFCCGPRSGFAHMHTGNIVPYEYPAYPIYPQDARPMAVYPQPAPGPAAGFSDPIHFGGNQHFFLQPQHEMSRQKLAHAQDGGHFQSRFVQAPQLVPYEFFEYHHPAPQHYRQLTRDDAVRIGSA